MIFVPFLLLLAVLLFFVWATGPHTPDDGDGPDGFA